MVFTFRFVFFFRWWFWIAQTESDGKRLKTSGCGDENRDSKAETESSSGQHVEQDTQPPSEPPKPDFIHVRARRGQATDSHSLAERVIFHLILLLLL